MRYVIERHTGEGEFERIGIGEGSGADPVAEAFEALDITEHADYRVYPEGMEHSPGFYRLNMDGTLSQLEHLT